MWENVYIALYPWLSKYHKNIYLYRTSIFYENYLVRKHITEKQAICPNSLQSHGGKMPGTQ